MRWLRPALRRGLVLLALPLLGAFELAAQGGALSRELAPASFLVAKRDLLDPNFTHTVIFLAIYDKEGAMGLVLNRPTKITLGRAFKDQEESVSREDPVYVGGPVTPGGVVALLHSESEPEGARKIMGNVYLVTTAEALENALHAGIGPDRLRVFSGYSGWGPGQLDREVEMGSWHIFKGSLDAVFDPRPESLWERFIERAELRIAWLPFRRFAGGR